jgi:DNA adenine methylase
MKSNKLFRYAGSKDKFLQHLLPIINKSSATIFHEPFLGSGAVFLNIEDRFDEYHLSDIQPAIVNAFNTVKHTTYNDYLDFTNMIKSVYGDIKKSKHAYYDFRNNYANVEFEKNFESIESGFSQLLLFSSCINSLARWNGKKFNQSFGNRLYLIDEKSYVNAKAKLMKATLTTDSFFDKILDNTSFNQNHLLFLDPPYVTRCYPFNSIKEQIDKLYDFCINTEADIVYTDIHRGEHDLLFDSNYVALSLRKNMMNSSPYNGQNKSTIVDAEEIVLYRLNN